MNNKKNQACQACLHPTLTKFGESEWVISGVLYHLEKCANCHTIFTSPVPSDETLNDLYKTSFNYNWYKDHYYAKLCDCRTRVKEYSNLLGNRVLDYGGGLGYFSRAVSEAGRESMTYDPYTTPEFSSDVKWDTIVLLHALEHSNNLDSTLSQIKELLTKGGRVIIAVPNSEGLGYQKQGKDWVWAQPPLLHIFHFTAKGLTALLSRYGFSNIDVKYMDRWDANTYCDIYNVDITRKMDSAWNKANNSSLPYCSKFIAFRNFLYRTYGLYKSKFITNKNNIKLSELQITATLTG